MPTKLSQYPERRFTKLRISLTEICNLACTYCVDDKNAIPAYQFLPNHIEKQVRDNPKSLSSKAFLNIVKTIHSVSPLQEVRLTGGEPLLFKGIANLVAGIKELNIPKVHITTNGIYLLHLASKLKTAGLHSVNLSLDAIDDTSFKEISKRSGLHRVIKGVDKLNELNIPFKINTVIMKGVNENQILPLIEFGMKYKAPVRFIELMKMGHINRNFNQYFYSQKEILKDIELKYSLNALERKPSATANYWETKSGFKIGIIANESAPFCHDCNRLRLDSYGNLYGCLSSSLGVNVTNIERNKMKNTLSGLILQKQQHSFKGNIMNMKYIGG